MDSVFIELLSVQYLVRMYKTNSNNKAVGGRNRFSTFSEPKTIRGDGDSDSVVHIITGTLFYPLEYNTIEESKLHLVRVLSNSGKKKRVLQSPPL